jgi:hypothetical protein
MIGKRGVVCARPRTGHQRTVRGVASSGPNCRPPINGGILVDANEIERKVSQSGSELTELKDAVKQLQTRVDRHAVVIQALKDMLLSSGELSEDEFLERLEHAVKQKTEGRNCRKCGKAMNAKHKSCMYCGEERPPELL